LPLCGGAVAGPDFGPLDPPHERAHVRFACQQPLNNRAVSEVDISTESAFILGVVSTLATLLVLWILLRLTGPWIMAYANGIPMTLIELVGMGIRGSDAGLIVATAIALSKFGEPVSLIDLEAAYLSLPDTQHNVTEMMRSVRPRLVTRLEADLQARAAQAATGP
jgi:uncharacterized protein YqfA (UPF0365 family)